MQNLIKASVLVLIFAKAGYAQDFGPPAMPPPPGGFDFEGGRTVPEEAEEAFNEATDYYKSGRYGEALASFRIVLAHGDSIPTEYKAIVYNEMAYAYLGIKDKNLALQSAKKAFQLNADFPEIIDTLGDVYKDIGDKKLMCTNFKLACAKGLSISCDKEKQLC